MFTGLLCLVGFGFLFFWFLMTANLGSQKGQLARIMNPAGYLSLEQRASRHFWMGFVLLMLAAWRAWG